MTNTEQAAADSAKVKLADRGTTGLLQYLASGTDRLWAARLATVLKILRRRKSEQAIRIFREVANDERSLRRGGTIPKLSPIKRLAAADAGDPTAWHHARPVEK